MRVPSFPSRCLAVLLLAAAAAHAAPGDDPVPGTPGAAAVKSAMTAAPGELPPLPPEPLPDLLAPGKPLRLAAAAKGQAVALTIHTAMLRPAFGALKAPAGQQLLVLNGEWKNVIPLKAAQEQKKPTEFKIPRLGDHLYVVVNGLEVGRLLAVDNTVAGHVPVVDFALPRVGDTLRGNMVFAISAAGPVRSLDVRFYDPESSNLVLPLVRPATLTPGVAAETDKPLNTPQRNEVLEAAVYGISRVPELDGKPAPPGTEFVQVDLRATSVAKIAARKSGEKDKPTVADWNDALKHVTLLVDNEYAAAPVRSALTTLGEGPRLLPDVPTGGRVVFRVPAKPKSLELQCDFPKAVVGGRVVTPRALGLTVEGSPPSKVDLKPLVPPVVDDAFFVAVTKIDQPSAFAGRTAEAGKRFLVLSITVANTGQTGEFFQPREQLKFLTSGGEPRPMDALAVDGPRAPAEPLWVPPGQRRAFQAVYRIDADESAYRLAYNGISGGEIVALPGGSGRGKVEAAKAVPPATAPAVAGADQPAEAPRPVRIKSPLPPDKPLVKDQKNFPSRVKAKTDQTPKGLAGVGLSPEQVNSAIDRGAHALWTRTQQRLVKQKQAFGDVAGDMPVALALVHAKYHQKDPAFDAALRTLLAKYDPKDRYQTYENGIACMIIEALGDRAFVPQLARSAQWLLDQQGPEGTWGYGRYLNREESVAGGPRRVLSVAGGRPPEENARGTRPLTRRTAAIDYTDGDNSVTQYALLGLHSAARSGFEVPRRTLAALLNETRDRQNDDGGWAYHGYGGASYGAMTCAGICAVALSKHDSGDKAPWDDQAIERGLAWLNAYFRVDDHPQSSRQWIYYYLYSLERVGRILDTEFIGDHEWYPPGAKFLVQNQRPNGLWWTESGQETEAYAEIPTSFALLFLTRATPSLGERQIPTGPGAVATAALLPPGNRLYVILDCSGSMLEPMDGREKFDIAKDAVRTLIADLPDNSEVALRAYGYRLRAIQPGASEDTKLLVPLKTLDRKETSGFIDGLRCRGKTPMALSLEEAAADLKGAASATKPITVVLLTDGGEDSQPRRDPVKAAALFATLPNVNLRIVGFDINRDDWRQQLTAMARAGRARYLPADRGNELGRELRSAVFGIPESCEVLDATGRPVKTMRFGETLPLDPGRYTLATTFGGERFTESFYVSPGETTTVTFDSGAIAQAAAAERSADPAPEAPAPPPSTATPPAAAEPPAEASKFCKTCKLPLKAGAKFCTRCGAKVEP